MTTRSQAAKRYLTLHPGSQDAAYAQYLIAASYYDQIPDVSRDQTRTERAIAALEEVGRKYPNSEYAAQAQRKIEMARDQLAAKDMNVARYYQSKKNFIGAINRFKIVRDAIPDDAARGRSADAARRILHGARHPPRGADRGRRARAQISPTAPGTRTPTTSCAPAASSPRKTRASWMSKAFKKIGLGVGAKVRAAGATAKRPRAECIFFDSIV